MLCLFYPKSVSNSPFSHSFHYGKILPNVWLVLSCFFVIKMTHGSFKWEQTAERKKQTICFHWTRMASVAVPFYKAGMRYPKLCYNLGSSNHRASVMSPNTMKPNHFPSIRGLSCFLEQLLKSIFPPALSAHTWAHLFSKGMSAIVFQIKDLLQDFQLPQERQAALQKIISHKVLWNFPCCCEDIQNPNWHWFLRWPFFFPLLDRKAASLRLNNIGCSRISQFVCDFENFCMVYVSVLMMPFIL